MNAPDLRARPPRSPRVRLGGYVVLPRVLDKCRAILAGTAGEYKFACPLDERLFTFAGITPEAFKAEVAKGGSDSDLLTWVNENSSTKPSATDIIAWSHFQEQRVPADTDSRAYFNEVHTTAAAHREDIATWFELLDLDDFVTFGGKA